MPCKRFFLNASCDNSSRRPNTSCQERDAADAEGNGTQSATLFVSLASPKSIGDPAMKAINPATEELIRDYPEHSPKEVEERLRRAESAFAAWRNTSFTDRSGLMRQAAHILREGRAGYARLMTQEMGKPIAASECEIDKCAWNCEFYVEYAATFFRSQDVLTDAARIIVRSVPSVTVMAII